MLLDAWSRSRSHLGGGAILWQAPQVAYLYVSISGLALCSAAFVGVLSTELIDGVLSAISILAGFSFATLIFFVDHTFNIVQDAASREQQVEQRKVDRLTRATFDIIYYFVAISIILIGVCLSYLVGLGISDRKWALVAQITPVTNFLGVFLFFVLCLEASITFFRMIRRLRYLFLKVRGVQ